MSDSSAMKIKSNVICQPFEGSLQRDIFILSNGTSRWKVDRTVYDIINLLREETPPDLLKSTLMELSSKVDGDDYDKKIDQSIEFLKQNGLIEGYDIETKKKVKPMWLKIQLLTGNTVGKIKILQGLYSKIVFCPCMMLELIWLIWMLTYYHADRIAEQLTGLRALDILEIFLFILFISMVHELGHVTALTYGGGFSKGIGIGMYLFLPVAWSDANDAWFLPKKDRLRVDFGGVYFQLLFTAIVYVLNMVFWGNSTIIFACIISAQTALFNLSPIMQFDGKWLVMDAFGVTDLKETTIKILSGRTTHDELSMSKHLQLLFVIIMLFSAALTIMFFSILAITLISKLL